MDINSRRLTTQTSDAADRAAAQAMVNQAGTVVQLHSWSDIFGLEDRCCCVTSSAGSTLSLLHGTLIEGGMASMLAGSVGAAMFTVTTRAVGSVCRPKHCASHDDVSGALAPPDFEGMRRPDELIPGLGKKVVRVQPGVQLIDLAKWLDARGYECSFAPGPRRSRLSPAGRTPKTSLLGHQALVPMAFQLTS